MLTKWLTVVINEKLQECTSSSTSTIIEYFGKSYINFDMSVSMNCGSLLREKEENFGNLCCETSQLTVEYHE